MSRRARSFATVYQALLEQEKLDRSVNSIDAKHNVFHYEKVNQVVFVQDVRVEDDQSNDEKREVLEDKSE